jgi:hypothetical protein
MDWCGSRPFAAEVRGGELTELECGCRWPLWWWPAWFPVVLFIPRRLFYVAPRGAGAVARPGPADLAGCLLAAGWLAVAVLLAVALFRWAVATARLVEAEERVARLRGVPEWGDLPELRARLAEMTRRAAEVEALDGAASGG